MSKKAGYNKNGTKLYKLTKEQYDTFKNIVEVHSDYLIGLIAESLVVLETRIEISKSLNSEREVIYYTGALEQTKIYLNMIIESMDNITTWCGVKGGSIKKRIKRKPVVNKNSKMYKKFKGNKK